MKKLNIKSTIVLLLVVCMFALSGCASFATPAEKLDPKVEEELNSCNWVYPEIATTYQSEREFEYWKLLTSESIKLFYDANYYLDYSDEIQKHIHCFYGDELEMYDTFDMSRGIEFSRLDHPELELLNTEGNEGSYGSSTQRYYYSTALNIDGITYDEYLAKVDRINKEIAPLVANVNAEEDLYEKYKMIYTWIIENYTYRKADEDVGNVEFTDDGVYLLARSATYSTQNIESILTKEAICDGFSDTFKYICNACNLECMTILGYVQARELEQYHAWNIIPYDGKWYLVDTTFGNNKKSYDYFMSEELFRDERTPLNMGIEIPMYKETEGQKLTFDDGNGYVTTITSEEGISFNMENEYYEMTVHSSRDIGVYLTEEGMYKILDDDDFSSDKTISSNHKISMVKYYSNGALIGEESINDNTVIFYEYLGEKYVDYIKVYVDVEGSMYEVKFVMCGA